MKQDGSPKKRISLHELLPIGTVVMRPEDFEAQRQDELTHNARMEAHFKNRAWNKAPAAPSPSDEGSPKTAD